ncbi:nucleotidyltransferase domain-containing protein [Plantactinospora soyae]|uniref:Nucleotidyltransferase n=1 Tax=Plantactinospora soyae TaxID=1544732 RepID=A0A927M541_9ACTN|nr:nucleotidyltransferase domain-containing protein [Plantactinospora soyae]MBE1488328.1 putative nucleotidyltransferase [Plantactinospora soyae]
MDILEQVMAQATADSEVRGVVLTGSRARGVATARSDFDLTIVVAEQTEPWKHTSRTGQLDTVVCTLEALADTSLRWQRYAYRGAKVLLDRLDGGIAELVDRQATPTREEAADHALASIRTALIDRIRRHRLTRRDRAARRRCGRPCGPVVVGQTPRARSAGRADLAVGRLVLLVALSSAWVRTGSRRSPTTDAELPV